MSSLYKWFLKTKSKNVQKTKYKFKIVSKSNMKIPKKNNFDDALASKAKGIDLYAKQV